MVTRREFLKRAGKATAASVVLGTGYLLADSRPDYPVEKTAARIELPFAKDDPILAGKLAVTRDDTPANLVRKAVAALGGIGLFISKGDRVVIKPNVGWDRTPEQAANTNPEAVAEMVRLCLAAGAEEVVVTDVTCNDPRRTFLRSGIQEAAGNAGAKGFPYTDDDFVEVDLGGKLLSVWPVLKYILDADKLINMPIVKHHGFTRATLGMKNFYGIIGGRRNQLHQKIDQSIVDLANFVRPTLVVTDCYRALMRNGPQGGSINDVKEYRTVVAGTDQVAVDAYAVRFLDLEPHDVGHIVLAESSGLGSMQLDEKTILNG